MKKVLFEEKWLNDFIENINLQDKNYLFYLEELEDEINKCICFSEEQKIFAKKYNIKNVMQG